MEYVIIGAILVGLGYAIYKAVNKDSSDSSGSSGSGGEKGNPNPIDKN